MEIINFPGSEPSLRLVWAQNQPNRQNTGYFAGIPGKPRVYLENTLPATAWISCRFPQFCVRFCPRPALRLRAVLLETLARVSRMEHQTPSVFPGNFRKRKVLGTLCFPFCLPENLVQANSGPTKHQIIHLGRVDIVISTENFFFCCENSSVKPNPS